jgi:SAM-dependent methyltransferase
MTNSHVASPTALARRVLGARQINHLVRFAPILDLVREVSATGGTLLDVGSGSRGIASLLPAGWHATSVDADFEDYGAKYASRGTSPEQVLGDVRALPFADMTFDVVIAVDLLEHVPADGREQAVRELCRVARSRVVVACPAGEEALAADRRLADRIRGGGRAVPPWLTEHLENGFPTATEIEAAAAPFGEVRVLANENIAAHERLVAAELTPLSAVVLRILGRPLEAMLASRRSRQRRLAGAALLAIRGSDHAPTYRAVIAIDIAGPS